MTPRNLRATLALIAVVALGFVLVQRLPQPPLADFVEYWAAGRLVIQGENPWDVEKVRNLESMAGRVGDPVLMWNPPWALLFVVPLGFLSPRFAYLVWQSVNGLAVCVAILLLMRIYAAPAREKAVWVSSFLFLPLYIAFAQGQIVGLMLLGAALVLLAARYESDFWMGFASTLLSIKPQVGLLIWAALGLWVISGRRWRVVLGLLVGITISLAIPLGCTPRILEYYYQAVTLNPPVQYATPTWGTFLRMAFGTERFWLQSIPPVLGLCWLAGYWFTRRAWVWSEQWPALAGMSLVTMGYGWYYDLLLMLPGVVHVVGSRPVPIWGTLTYLVLNTIALIQSIQGTHGMWYVWAAPAYLALYLLLLPRGNDAHG